MKHKDEYAFGLSQSCKDAAKSPRLARAPENGLARCPGVHRHFAAASRRDPPGALALATAARRIASAAPIERDRYAIDGANNPFVLVFVTSGMGAVGGSFWGAPLDVAGILLLAFAISFCLSRAHNADLLQNLAGNRHSPWD
jgi:hypothetical protein